MYVGSYLFLHYLVYIEAYIALALEGGGGGGGGGVSSSDVNKHNGYSQVNFGDVTEANSL